MMPLPREEVTPPVTKIYLVLFIQFEKNCVQRYGFKADLQAEAAEEMPKIQKRINKLLRIEKQSVKRKDAD